MSKIYFSREIKIIDHNGVVYPEIYTSMVCKIDMHFTEFLPNICLKKRNNPS